MVVVTLTFCLMIYTITVARLCISKNTTKFLFIFSLCVFIYFMFWYKFDEKIFIIALSMINALAISAIIYTILKTYKKYSNFKKIIIAILIISIFIFSMISNFISAFLIPCMIFAFFKVKPRFSKIHILVILLFITIVNVPFLLSFGIFKYICLAKYNLKILDNNYTTNSLIRNINNFNYKVVESHHIPFINIYTFDIDIYTKDNTRLIAKQKYGIAMKANYLYSADFINDSGKKTKFFTCNCCPIEIKKY